MPPPTELLQEKKVVRVVFLALLLDLLSFTIILPLFPRLLNFYQLNDTDNTSILSYLLHWLEGYKDWIGRTSDSKWDTVILGGLIGSLFSLLQFIISPQLGNASDTYGRRKVLLCTMICNILSTGIWLVAQSFSLFLLARVIAGLSEGNVQLSIAIISDITSPENRSKNMALVGIAFATAFTFGPPIGAWFASIDLSQTWLSNWIPGLYPYSMAALVGLVLLLIETLYLFSYLPETAFHTPTPALDPQQKQQQLKSNQDQTRLGSNIQRLNLIQCLFTFLFSGMEFTLVFLTFDVLDYSHMQQGKLLGFMGILSALIQGGYVRRRGQKIGEKRLVMQGILFGAMGLGCLAVVGMGVTTTLSQTTYWLYGGVACLAMTSGTVVNCLTSLASLQCQHDKEKGKILGVFRSFGQLGRACGPLSACTIYWLLGPTMCYSIGTISMFCLLLLSAFIIPHPLPSHPLKLD